MKIHRKKKEKHDEISQLGRYRIKYISRHISAELQIQDKRLIEPARAYNAFHDPLEMLLANLKLPQLAFSKLRYYSVISIQSTVSKKANSLPTSNTINTPTSKEEDIHTELPHLQDPIVNLERARTNFKDKHGLYNKIDTLIHSLRTPDSPIRIGLINSSPSLLNALLADPFASDETWYNSLKNRSLKENILVKYSASFDVFGNTYSLPSPFLNPQSKNLELYQLNELTGSDGCHLYISFGNTMDTNISKWPVYDWVDHQGLDEGIELGNKEVNSALTEHALNQLAESPNNATTFTKLYAQTNFKEFIKFIDNVSKPDVAIQRLSQSLVKNLTFQQIEESLTLEELTTRDNRIKKHIAKWDENSHIEFQREFKPYVDEFEKTELAWWKLYYKNDDIQELLKTMLNQGLLNDSLKNYSYIKGQIDSFTSFDKQAPKFSETLTELDQNALTQLKEKIIKEDSVIIQNKVTKILLTNFIGIQIPTVFIASLGYFLFDFSLYSMLGLGSLGLTVGFNNVSKSWVRLITNFKKDLFENVRLAIVKVNDSLLEDWNNKYQEEKEQILQRERIIESIKEAI